MKLDKLSVDELLVLRSSVMKELKTRAKALRKQIEFIERGRKRRGRRPKFKSR